MIQTIIQQLDIASILLIAALITALVIAFKIMEMIFDTVLVAGISAAFYVALRTIQGGSITFNDLLLFTFLGSATYMTYTILKTLINTAEKIIPIPIHIIQNTLKPVKYMFKKAKKLLNQEKTGYAPRQNTTRQKNKDKKDEETQSKTTKEVILGQQKNKDKKDEEEDEKQ